MYKRLGLLLASAMMMLLLSGCSSVGGSREAMSAYVDKVEQKTVLMFNSSKEDLNIGELYLKTLGDERERVADSVFKGEYKLMADTNTVLFLDSKNILYVKEKGKEKERVADGVLKSAYYFNEDEQTITFLRQVDSSPEKPVELYIKKLGLEKEKISSDMSRLASTAAYKISSDGQNIYYVNKDKSFYSKEANKDKEKIASDVEHFSVNPRGNAYAYLNNQGSYYVKWSNDIEPQKVTTSKVGSLVISRDGLAAVFTADYNNEKNRGELYIVTKGQSPIKVASDVKRFDFTSDGRNIFYLNDEGMLYVKPIPKIADKTYTNTQKFIDELNQLEKIKLGSDIESFQVGPEGANAVFIDKDKNLYFSYNKREKVKVASDVVSVRLFPHSFAFINKEKQLYLNSKISDSANLTSNNNMIGQSVDAIAASAFGKYIAFIDHENKSAVLCIEGQKPEEMISSIMDYDTIIYNASILYDKKLEYKESVGIYKNSKLDVLYSITQDKQFVLYQDGLEKEKSPIKVEGSDKISLTFGSSSKNSELNQSRYKFIKGDAGKWKLSVGIESYDLESITEDELKKELARQKKEAENKAAEESRKEALRKKKEQAHTNGDHYLTYGKYIYNYESLYASPSFSSEYLGTFNDSGSRYIYDYKVTNNGDLWVKAAANNGYGYFDVWIYVGD